MCKKLPFRSLTPLLLTLLIALLPLTATAKVRVYILAGQSNMMGKGKTHQLPAAFRTTPPNIQFYYQGRARKLARFAWFGPEVGFAHAIAKAYPHDTHIIIKQVATGSSIRQWLPGSRLYQGLLRQQELVKLPADASIEAILWMQGETDARNKQSAVDYKGRLKRLIAGLRSHLEAPNLLFIMGKINPEDAAFNMTETVQQAQQQIQHQLPNTLLVSTDGLGKLYDHVHYDTRGQLELGKRFAEAYLLAQKKRHQ